MSIDAIEKLVEIYNILRPKNIPGKHFWGKAERECLNCGIDSFKIKIKYMIDEYRPNSWKDYANSEFPCLTENEAIIKNIIE